MVEKGTSDRLAAGEVKPLVLVEIPDLNQPEQILGLIENESVRDFATLVCMSQGVFPSDGRPEWVIRAAGELWRCCFGFSKSRLGRSELYRLGFSWGFGKQVAPQLQGGQLGAAEKGIIAMVTSGQIGQLLHSSMESAPVAEAAEFYNGLADGLRTPAVFSP